MNYLLFLPETANLDEIVALHEERQRWVRQDKKGFLRYRKPFEHLAAFRAEHVDCTGDTVILGSADEVSDQDRDEIRKSLQAFMPWRKGPFSVFGVDIDSEWRSCRKWQRLLPVLPDLREKNVADIGCNNGYYMFRMAPYQPRLVLGFEPTVQHYYSFKALNGMARRDELQIDLLGVEHLNLFPSCFDVIFLMGVIYHRPSPVDTLKDILTALQPGGCLLLESQAIPGDDPIALFPDSTYAKVPGTYFVPSGPCLVNWLKKAGFVDIEPFCCHPMSAAEQRRTDWMTFESYQDFLQPDAPHLTLEGYPAPWRVFVKARKKT
jgi:tRNA (mo5U34)-methyltransferase